LHTHPPSPPPIQNQPKPTETNRNPTDHRQLTAYGKLDKADEAGMMSEIMAKGPITCGVAAPDEFVYKYHSGRQGGVYVDDMSGCFIWGGGRAGLYLEREQGAAGFGS
jgi:hypothetical protein